jgi:hypothetical protein
MLLYLRVAFGRPRNYRKKGVSFEKENVIAEALTNADVETIRFLYILNSPTSVLRDAASLSKSSAA